MEPAVNATGQATATAMAIPRSSGEGRCLPLHPDCLRHAIKARGPGKTSTCMYCRTKAAKGGKGWNHMEYQAGQQEGTGRNVKKQQMMLGYGSTEQEEESEEPAAQSCP